MHHAAALGLLLAASLALLPAPALSQPLDDSPEAEVVVTATRRRQAKQTASAPVTIVTGEEIASSGAATAAEALRGATGVDVRRQGPLGAVASPSLRGAGAGQVLVLVDGRRINNPQLGQADLSDIPAENIERIEIVRGGASALYGSDAIGGVINIITRSPERGRRMHLTQGFGSLNTYVLTGAHTGSTGRVRYTVSGQRARSDNDFPYDDPVTGTRMKRRNSGYTAWDLTARASADLGGRRRLTLSTEYSDADKDLPGSLSYPTPRANQQDRRLLLDLQYQMTTGRRGDLSARYYRVQHRNRYTDPGAFPAPMDALHRTTVDVFEVLGHATPHPGHDATYGYETRAQRARSTTIGRRSQDVHALYAQDQIRMGRLQVIPGARVDFTQGFAGELSPKLGLVYRLGERTVGRANVGRAFRAPTLNDLHWPEDPFARGNPALRPERALTADLGASWKPSPRVEVEGSLFWHRVSDLIVWQPGVLAPGKWSPVNVGQARILGIEVGTSWQAHERLQAHLNLTLQDARDRSGAPNTHGKRLLLRPAVLLHADAAYRLGRTRLRLGLDYTGRRPADATNDHFVGGALLADLHLETPLSERVTVSLQASNVLDKHYEMQPGYPLPGRTVTVRLSEAW